MGISDGMFTGDVQRAIEDIRKQLQNLTSGRRLEDASIGARGIRLLDGGTLTISGGAIRMNDATGSVGLLYFGPDSAGVPRWLFSFDDGELAGGLFGSPGANYWKWLDRAGNEIFSSDGLTGVGLSRPWLPLRLVPSSEAQISGTSFYPSHTSGSFTRLWTGFNPIFHPKVEIGVAVATIGGGTARWRLVINGTDATGEVTGGGTRTVSIPGWGDTVHPANTVEFSLEARIADGGTRVLANVDKFFSRQS